MKRTILISCLITVLVGNLSAAARQGVVDDGFTWLEAVNGEALGPNNIPVSTGWYLRSYIRILGTYPNRSAIKVIISKGGKALATTRCETSIYVNNNNALDESYMQTADCGRKDTAIKELGVLEAQVYTVNGDTDEEKLVRTYTIDVRTVNRVRSGQEAGLAPPQYYINRHAEAPVSWMVLRPREYGGYLDPRTPERLGANHVEFYFNLSPSEVGKKLPHSYMRCAVNGKRLSMPGPVDFSDQALLRSERSYVVIHQDRIAPKYQRGTEYQDEIGFRTVRLLAPLTWGERENRWETRLALEDYPGNWECSLMNNGEVWRTWRFSIGSNGRPPMHPEQTGNINLNYNSYLVEIEIPAGGSALDGRLNGASTGLFYGQPWTSPEGKSMAGRVPKKGNPFPVPSNSPNAVVQWWEK